MNNLIELGQAAKQVERLLAQASTQNKNNVLLEMAESLLQDKQVILEANKKDTDTAKKAGITKA